MPPSECPACEGAGFVELYRRPTPEARGKVPFLATCPDCRGGGKIIHMLDDIPLTEEEAGRLGQNVRRKPV